MFFDENTPVWAYVIVVLTLASLYAMKTGAISSWVVPTVYLGGFALGGLWEWRKAKVANN